MPEGATTLEVGFDYLAKNANGSEEGASSRDFIGLPWSQAVLYPAGHHASAIRTQASYFKDWDKSPGGRDLLPHEFAHSWNCKFRRPAELLTPHFNLPGSNHLLWVYEGQTQFWGVVLAARSGLVTAEQTRHVLARTAAYLSSAAGRRWRPLQDTTHQGIVRGRTLDTPWRSWTRGEDYYAEAMLLWIEADMLIREQTGGMKSLDDFARSFFGVQDGRVEPLPYTFDDIVAALNAVHPHDWRAFLRQRLDGLDRAAPIDGLARAGWKLEWDDKPSPFDKPRKPERRFDDFFHSLGFGVGKGAAIAHVNWDTPAFRAGLALGAEVMAVNDMAYTAERLDDALKANKDGKNPIRLLVKEGERFRTITFDYREGPRHPKLVRIEGTIERLDSGLLAPR